MTANQSEQNTREPQVSGATSNGNSESLGVDSDMQVSETETLQLEIDRLTAEASEFKDKYVRSVAEMENVRRRMERERTDLLKFGLEGMIKDLLPVLDSFDKALPEVRDDQADPSQSSYVAGMLMVKKQLIDTLKKQGLEVVEASGASFDPNVHQAIQRIESPEVSTEVVGEVYARGYLLHGRLIRPAMVSVLVPS